MEEQEAEIDRLRAEVADLNELLVESARTLSEVNKKVRCCELIHITITF